MEQGNGPRPQIAAGGDRSAGPSASASPPLLWRNGTSAPERIRLLSAWRGVFDRLAIGDSEAQRIAARARANGTSIQSELRASGLADEEEHFRAVAAELDLPFLAELHARDLHLSDADAMMLLSRSHCDAPVSIDGAGVAQCVFAPANLDLDTMRAIHATRAGIGQRLFVVTPSRLRAALIERVRPTLMADACNGFFARSPELSARQVTNGWQGFLLGVALLALAVCLAVAPVATAVAFYSLVTAMFLACIVLRLAVVCETPPPPPAALPAPTPAELPHYSAIVALWREAEVVPDLLAALARLKWPRSKLEIKLVCEADDAETLAAIARHRLRPWIEIVRVPPCTPRTKPKALAFAMPLLSGDFVAVYDAEDRPHPDQLFEAWNRFRSVDDGVGCVQAPLVIANHAFGALPLLFRFEYAALFEGILPWLSARGLLLTLGGTSNHFRRSVLKEIGGWDPYNVTEDADIAVRLARHGYRCETVACATLEDAPEDVGIWIRQRTRWFKGWLQTLFVHMRDPVRLYTELGPASFLVFHVLFTGMIASALFHPLLLGTALFLSADLLFTGTLSRREFGVLLVSVANLAFGYGAFILLGHQCLPPSQRAGFWRTILLTPPYWLLMSLAAWRGVLEFFRRPHHWEKTPHRRFRRRDAPPAAADRGRPP